MEDFERSELMGSQHDAMSSVTELSEERYQAALLNYRNWRVSGRKGLFQFFLFLFIFFIFFYFFF